MNRLVRHTTCFGIVALAALSVSISAQDIIPRAVQSALADSSASTPVDLIVAFQNDLDITGLRMAARRDNLDRSERYESVMNQLLVNRHQLQQQTAGILDNMKAAGILEEYHFYTVAKVARIRIKAAHVAQLLGLPEIQSVELNEKIELIRPVSIAAADPALGASLANDALSAINVRPLWERGLNGEGIIVCSFDTGIDEDHPALSGKWRGNNGGTLAESWFAPHGTSLPSDKVGHGTHVMGVLVGSTDSDTIGVAPSAQWISAGVIDQGVNLSTTIGDILNAFDWALDPDGDPSTTDDVPAVICNSWGVPSSLFDPCNNTFQTAIDNVEAAGIVTIFAAGNEGPESGTIRNPASLAQSPLDAFSVGAINPADSTVASFSSRGPGGCGNEAIKPEIVAPGVSIYSSFNDGAYRTMSGTSMAAPFVAGVAALLRQFNPYATVNEIKSALIEGAYDLGGPGEDNASGHGLLDAEQALLHMPAPVTPQAEVADYELHGGDDDFADPGETALLDLTVNLPSGEIDYLDMYLESGDPTIAVEADTVRFDFAGGSAFATNATPFVVSVFPEAISGKPVALTAFILFSNNARDTLSFDILIGHELPGYTADLNSGDLTLTLSDFGQFGFGHRSIYQAGGQGLRFANSENLLFEGAVATAVSEQLQADGLRSANGTFTESDFAVTKGLQPDASTFFADEYSASYTDGNAVLPIPLEVHQTVGVTGQNFVFFSFELANPLPQSVTNLAFGMLWDFDLDPSGEIAGFDDTYGISYLQDPSTGLYVGLLALGDQTASFYSGRNAPDGQKRGFTASDKYALLTSPGVTIEPGSSNLDDWFMMINWNGIDLAPLSKTTVHGALLAGRDLSELRYMAELALTAYDQATDVGDDPTGLPLRIDLQQNFPNPFNPETTIRFTTPTSGPAELTVFNILGQKVRTLLNEFVPAGEHQIAWDGKTDGGSNAASGVYLYRLSTKETQLTRKMTLLR